MNIVVKVGGSLLDRPPTRAAIARQLAQISATHPLVVVHGGGKQVTRFLEERGISSEFVDGLRVSGEPVIDAVLQVIAGSVNKRLVSALVAAGVSAVGLSGVDGALTIAEQMNPALGFVGNPGPTDARLLNHLLSAGFLPVLACVAGDRHGSIYNVNADQMAVSCAIGWNAQTLMFLTDVDGVKDAAGRSLPHLSSNQVVPLIRAGVAHGGMRAKLEAALLALENGVAEIIVAPGEQPDVCSRLLAGEPLGTRLSLSPVIERSLSA